MADRNERSLFELLKIQGNDVCADCGCKQPEWASYNIGVFLCTRCASVHRSMGAHISKVKHMKLDRWEDAQVEHMKGVGNLAANQHYLQHVPLCYRRPVEGDPQILIEQWVRAKYQREEFIHKERQSYMSGSMEGFLQKRGKDDNRYQPRRFVLSEVDDTLKYFVKEKKEPKATLRISELNVSFAPEKTGVQNSLQLTYLKDNNTRHIFVQHSSAEIMVNWYHAIRSAKLNRLQIAFPSASNDQLLGHLTKDFAREGWLWKTGPRSYEGYKKRWFTLDHRKLMYHDDPMDANPKGEIFLGHMLDGYSVRVGVPPGAKDQGFSFTLRTPDRVYHLSAHSDDDRDEWIRAIDSVLVKNLSPQDTTVALRLNRSKRSSNSLTIFTSR